MTLPVSKLYTIQKTEAGWQVTNNQTHREFIVSLTAKTVMDKATQKTIPTLSENKGTAPARIFNVIGGVHPIKSDH